MGDHLKLWIQPDEVPWGTLRNGAWAKAFLEPMWQRGTSAYIANADVQLCAVGVRDELLPCTINDGVTENTWTVSAFNQYVTYAIEELRELDNAALRVGLHASLLGLGGVLRAGRVDRCVWVDNWLLSTNLHPQLSDEELAALHGTMLDKHPTHAIGWRSVHTWRDDPLRGQLERLGYLCIPSRSCWMFDPADARHMGARDLKHDRRCLRRGGYTVLGPGQLERGDIVRLRELYNRLYLDKYSLHNPQFTEAFVENAVNGALQVYALRSAAGSIDGVVGFFERAGFMTTPLFGWDTHQPVKLGLYRMLSWVLVEQAQARGLVLHQSAGAASFKAQRRAEPAMEVSAVYVAHLPARTRLAWRLLHDALWKIAVPLVQRQEL
ncbi:MAG: hypothetical protein ACI9MC_001378 [Kiritimatiellia bacterium]|jgi:hypothetical protein